MNPVTIIIDNRHTSRVYNNFWFVQIIFLIMDRFEYNVVLWHLYRNNLLKENDENTKNDELNNY